MYPEERQKFVNDLRLIYKSNDGKSKSDKLLDNTPNQPSKFKTKKWVEINGDLPGVHNTNSKIKFKTFMLRSNLCDYNQTYIFVKEI